jgi:hypothetical protein
MRLYLSFMALSSKFKRTVYQVMSHGHRLAFLSAVIGLAGTPAAYGQSSSPAPAITRQAEATSMPWTDLSPAQRTSLQPLEASWSTLADGHKRKWLALAQNYPNLGAAEQAKLHSRMAEWAALKPRDRELARLNFAESKKLTPAARAANWEAYQALSPEEKQKLASKAAVKPTGAAVASKSPANKLTAVPVTRLTPESERSKVAAQQLPVDRNTLLPVAAPQN